MSKPTKILLISLTLVIMVPFITLLALSKLHHRVVHEELVEIIKNELEGKVEFEDFKFSYLRSFPRVHAEFINMTIHDSNGGVSKISDLDVFLDFSEIMQRKVLIDKLVVSDAFFMSVIDSLGNKPRIFSGGKKSNDNADNILLVESHDVEILNSRVFIENKVKGNKLMASISSGLFNLTVADSAVLISGNVSASLDTLISNHNLLLKNQPAIVQDVVFRIDNETGVKELERGIILAQKLELVPQIKMTPVEHGQQIDLRISSEGNFDAFLEVLDFHFDFELEQVNTGATLAISYNQQGIVNPFLRPYLEIDFKISNAKFKGNKLPYPIENFYFQGNLNNGDSHSPKSSVLVIDTLNAEISDSYINGRFKMSNFNDPTVDAHLRSSLNLSHLIEPNDDFALSGNIKADLMVNGKIRELKKIHLEEKQHAKGTINVSNLNLLLKKSGYNLYLENGSTILNNHMFEVTTLVGAINESAFHFEGVLDNLDQYLTNEHKELAGEINLNFGRLDLNKFNLESSSTKTDTAISYFNLPRISLDVKIAGDQVVGDFGEITNFRMKSRISPKDIKINKLTFQYQEGEVIANAGIFLKNYKIDSLTADVSGKFDHLILSLPTDTLQIEENQPPLSLPAFIYADINLEVDEGKLFSIPLQNLSLATQINGRKVSIPDLSFEAFGGQAQLSGQFYFDEKEIVEIKVNSELNFDFFDLGQYVANQEKQAENSNDFTFADLPERMDVQFGAFVKRMIYKDQIIRDFSGNIDVNNNAINIRSLSASLPFGQFDMGLIVNNIKSVAPNYSGSIDLQIDTLHLGKLLKSEALDLPNKSSTRSQPLTNTPKRVFIPNSRIEVKSRADRIFYQNDQIDKMELDVIYNSDIIEMKKLDFCIDDGHVSTYGYILNSNAATYDAYINSKVDSIDIQKILIAFNNFNQEVFNAENSSGIVSWNSHLFLQLDQSLSPITRDNLWKFDISVHNGKFRKIEPIEKALFFVGHKAKDDLIVSELNIDAYVYDNKILFKDVFINDNIANLDLFGEIDIADSIIDVGIEISLSDLLFRSKKERIKETKNGETHLDSDMKLFLKIQGPLADHQLKKSSGRKFKRSRKNLDEIIEKAEAYLTMKAETN